MLLIFNMLPNAMNHLGSGAISAIYILLLYYVCPLMTLVVDNRATLWQRHRRIRRPAAQCSPPTPTRASPSSPSNRRLVPVGSSTQTCTAVSRPTRHLVSDVMLLVLVIDFFCHWSCLTTFSTTHLYPPSLSPISYFCSSLLIPPNLSSQTYLSRGPPLLLLPSPLNASALFIK